MVLIVRFHCITITCQCYISGGWCLLVNVIQYIMVISPFYAVPKTLHIKRPDNNLSTCLLNRLSPKSYFPSLNKGHKSCYIGIGTVSFPKPATLHCIGREWFRILWGTHLDQQALSSTCNTCATLNCSGWNRPRQIQFKLIDLLAPPFGTFIYKRTTPAKLLQ